jgi:hypothetical protein
MNHFSSNLPPLSATFRFVYNEKVQIDIKSSLAPMVRLTSSIKRETQRDELASASQHWREDYHQRECDGGSVHSSYLSRFL